MTDTIWVHLIETQAAGDMAASERKFGSDSLATRDSSCRILHKIAHAKRAYQYHVREGFNCDVRASGRFKFVTICFLSNGLGNSRHACCQADLHIRWSRTRLARDSQNNSTVIIATLKIETEMRLVGTSNPQPLATNDPKRPSADRTLARPIVLKENGSLCQLDKFKLSALRGTVTAADALTATIRSA